MAITEIHAIESTPNLALAYVRSDKVEKHNSDKEIPADIRHFIFWENGQKYIRYSTHSTYQNGNMDDPISAYEKRAAYGRGRLRKEAPRTKSGKEIVMWHLVQSFPEKISPVIANEIGQKLAAEVFGNFTVTISTHTNKENIHNHLMISAWDMDGRKWHDCHATKRQIRSVSDRLCKEYGLSVLEKTQDMKLVKRKDKDGVTRYFEPTGRKMQILRQREKQEAIPDSVRSYRHTPQYRQQQQSVMSNREQIRHDIDMLLPSVPTYECLLGHLLEMGYRIKDERKNGNYLAHVTFQAPHHEKGTRDSSLGEFYGREQLSEYIRQKAQRELEQVVQRENTTNPLQNVPYFADYDYDRIDLSSISDTHKAVKADNGYYNVVERTATEKQIISHVRINDSEVRGLIDTTEIRRIIAAQAHTRVSGSRDHKTQEEQLVAQIQRSFRCLRYTERHHISSYQQICDLYASYKGKYDATIANSETAEQIIYSLKEVLQTAEKSAFLESKIAIGKNDVMYVLEEFSSDKKALEQCKSLLKKYKIATPEDVAAFKNKVDDFDAKQEVNRNWIGNIKLQMTELENCMETFARIDRESGRGENPLVQEFGKLSGRTFSTNRSVQELEKKKRTQVHDDR